ncbi:hypothetical protein ACWEPM_04435 [Streptomyces sp. NPDC004244]
MTGLQKGRFHAALHAAHTWVATIAALGALGLSVYNFLQLQKDPTIEVMLPHSLKMDADPEGVSVFPPADRVHALRHRGRGVGEGRPAAPATLGSRSRRPAGLLLEADREVDGAVRADRRRLRQDRHQP